MAQRACRGIRKVHGYQNASGLCASATNLRGCLHIMLLVFARQSCPEEQRLLTPSHGARQRATPTLKVRDPSLVVGEFRQRLDRHFVDWPFGTSSLPEFPSRAQRWRLLFVSAEILRSAFSSRPQDSFESPSD